MSFPVVRSLVAQLGVRHWSDREIAEANLVLFVFQQELSRRWKYIVTLVDCCTVDLDCDSAVGANAQSVQSNGFVSISLRHASSHRF
jgi:hypothetical protein